MNNWFTDQENPSSREEEQASILIEAWAQALREAVPSPNPDCPPSPVLYAFSQNGLGPELSRQVLLHLSSCGHCRQEEYQLRQEPTFGRGLNLQLLRRATKMEQPQVAGLIDEVRDWLGVAFTLSATLPGTRELTISGVLFAGEDQPPAPAEVTLRQPARLDRQGRLRFTMSADQVPPDFNILLTIGDGKHRLELGAFDPARGEVQVVADCAFLKLTAGELASCFLSFAMMPQAMGSRWLRPALIPRLQTILQETVEVVEVWDRVLVLFAMEGDKWPEILRRELRDSDDLSGDSEVLEGIKAATVRFLALWQMSNDAKPPLAMEIVSELDELLQGTQTRRRKTREAPTDATIVKKGLKGERRKERTKVEVEE